MVHEWLDTYAGSERCLEQILLLFPDADLFAVVDFLPDDQRGFVGGRHARTTFVQRLPFARRAFRAYLPLMPLAIEQLDLSGYDLVVSSNHAVAKGVLTGPDQLHVCYCHSPLRYAWDLQHEYLRESGLGFGPRGLLTRWLLHRLRAWDARSAGGVDLFVANSAFVARRIRKSYRRDAHVVAPPVDVDRVTPGGAPRGDYYLTASRMVAYKRVELIVEAFRDLPDRRLVVVGDGPQMPAVRRLAGPNVELLGRVSDDVLLGHLRSARAFVYAAVEDFGIAPLEAQAAGTPVIAFRGGALPATIPGLDAAEPCGVFYGEQSPGGVRDGIRAFEDGGHRITGAACRRNAERFAPDRFRAEFARVVDCAWAALRREVSDGATRPGAGVGRGA